MKDMWNNVKTKPILLFTLLLLLKEYLARWVLFGNSSLWATLLVALPTILAAVTIIELTARKRKIAIYMTLNILLTSVYFAAIMYHKYFGIVVTYRALEQANQVTEVNSSVFNLMHPYFLLIYTDIVILAFLLSFGNKLKFLWKNDLSVNRWVAVSLLSLSLIASVSRVYAHKGIVNEIKQAEEMGILNYEIYAILKDLKPAERVDPAEITQTRIDSLKKITTPVNPKLWKAAEGKNILIVQMESFQNFLIGLQVNGQELTPNLTGLSQESLYFPNVYQTVGQGNTSDAEFVMNTSFYTPEDGAATTKYTDRDLPSMPKLLKNYGYESLTFHTNDVEFWNRKELYRALGFDRYYDKPFFGNEDQIAFGASDEVLYRKTVAELKKETDAGHKFYANVISMSSHHPYHLPESKKMIDLPAEYQDTLVGRYLIAQHYADYAIGKLIDEMKMSGLWDQTVLVLYGDHVGLTMNLITSNERKLLEDMLHKPYSYDEMLNIPLIIHVPGMEPQVLPQLGGQVDFMPTIANLAGASMEGHLHFGEDIINQETNLLGERYYLPTGSFVSDRMVFIPGEKVDDGITVPVAGQPISGTKEEANQITDDFKRALGLMNLSDSYVEGLPELDKK